MRFADAVNILVGLMIVRGGDDQIGIVDVLSLVLFFQDQDLSLRLEFQKLRIDFGSDDGQILVKSTSVRIRRLAMVPAPTTTTFL